LGAEVVTALLTRDKLTKAGGTRYIKARRPELYASIIGKPHVSDLKIIWLEAAE
jgi:hypothetical protein